MLSYAMAPNEVEPDVERRSGALGIGDYEMGVRVAIQIHESGGLSDCVLHV